MNEEAAALETDTDAQKEALRLAEELVALEGVDAQFDHLVQAIMNSQRKRLGARAAPTAGTTVSAAIRQFGVIDSGMEKIERNLRLQKDTFVRTHIDLRVSLLSVDEMRESLRVLSLPGVSAYLRRMEAFGSQVSGKTISCVEEMLKKAMRGA